MIAYFDIFSGISGDMTLGALVDAGVPAEFLQKELSGLLDGFTLETETVFRHHLKATDLMVKIDGQDKSSRNYTDIRSMIESSGLSDRVKKSSLDCFEKIARAEASIHGKEIETVHFHEIGGIDSIVDIVGSFLAVEYLGIKKVYASAVPLGSGTIECAHGKIPVPVPATAAILKDIPVCASDATTEIVTPTGAAIIATLCRDFGQMPEMSIRTIGYGAGKRETGSSAPNLLRIILGRSGAETGSEFLQTDTVMVVKSNVDDMSPEISGFLMETLFENHALDVCFVPVMMKKNRPGIQVEVLCKKENLDTVIQVILSQSSTIGVRYHECRRAMLQREAVTLETRFGPVQVKKITDPDGGVRHVPEYDAARKIAKEKKIPLKEIYQGVLLDANTLDRE